MASISRIEPWQRALIYGAVGVNLEVAFTAIKAKKPELQGFTQVWVVPIYAAGAMAVEILRKNPQFKNTNVLLRAIAYALIFFSIEYSAGYGIKKMIGKCPWEYTGKYSVHGYIKASYFPIWCALGLLAERVTAITRRVALVK